MNSLTTGAPGTPFMDGREIKKISMQTITLDTLCNQSNLKPDLMKIDVEGAELLVLHGARKFLGESCPIIVLAVHPYWLPKGQSTQQIFEYLTGYGYTVYDSEGCQTMYLQSGEYLCLNAKAGHTLAK